MLKFTKFRSSYRLNGFDFFQRYKHLGDPLKIRQILVEAVPVGGGQLRPSSGSLGLTVPESPILHPSVLPVN
jgi:hypothetical protein